MLVNYRNAFVYQDEHLVLRNVNFEVNEGDLIYIIGKVGEGKSSLLKTIYAELDIKEDSGPCEVLGEDMHKLKFRNIPNLRRQMGIIFQDFKLLEDRSIGNNLRFVLEATGWKNIDEIEDRIIAALTEVDMLDSINKMPYMLSGGQKQRISIARAILNNPKIILADEPTGHLDPESEEGILQLFQDISKKGTAVVISTHHYHILDRYPGTVYKCQNKEFFKVTDFNELSDIDERA